MVSVTMEDLARIQELSFILLPSEIAIIQFRSCWRRVLNCLSTEALRKWADACSVCIEKGE